MENEKTELAICCKLIQRMIEHGHQEMSVDWAKEVQLKLLDLAIHLEKSIQKQPGGGNPPA